MHNVNNLILYSENGIPSTFGEKLSTAAITLLLGMLAVFLVLLIIMLVITIVGKIFQSLEKKKAAKAVEQPAPVTEQPAVPVDEEEPADDGALIAAITAAVALCMEEEPGSFRVVSFKKTGTKPAWNRK